MRTIDIDLRFDMHGIQQGIMDAGRELGRFGGRALEGGCDGLGALEIVWLVLGGLLWAALMTALVMGMIALARYLRASKGAKVDGADKDKKSKKK